MDSTTLTAPPAATRNRVTVPQRIVEIVSDSGEGAQKAGQTFGTVCAKLGNGVWTVEIIPAEIKPPARSRAGASGIRVRFADREVTNRGERADLVVAFNEQVLYGRIESRAYGPGTIVLLENKWADDPQEEIRALYAQALEDFRAQGLEVVELPLEKACLEVVPDARVGKNMFVVGMLCEIFGRDLGKALDEVATVFRRKGEKVVASNQELLRRGAAFAAEQVPFAWDVPAPAPVGERLVMNGNQALGLGILAAGIETVAMYPITPATSVSHYLGRALPAAGGFLHQAEDEIAAIGFAIGASWAGKTACTITSGPGLALKMEFLGFAVMAEVPLVVLLVQRGGPSTGLPTKVEQGDLLSVLYGAPGDSPKIVLAPATIEECFHFVPLARRLAEEFRGPVLVLTDANLATGVAPVPRPHLDPAWLAPPLDQGAWPEGVAAYDWDSANGLSLRPIPGQRGGEYVLTGLAHTRKAKVAYDAVSNQEGCEMRSRKLAALGSTLVPPVPRGADSGEMLVVGWGSTLGAIEEAVDGLRSGGHSVASLHLRFLSPLEPGLTEIFSRFDKVMTVELNYSDDADWPGMTPEIRRRAQLAQVLRERTLVDVDCWSAVRGQPFGPGEIAEAVLARLASAGTGRQGVA
ncbi:MAG: 2-oxoacid:acceptor oxidoreductase subunit alpha [Thermoanaerobaculia bacterium]|nr:MAG: 2-oxoacid:acceptor oxidoreductase subunit alpha [Thermoanaerobaculia bacterium]MBZ0101440.1 2-oxoacid:acceptor oxidoreductase subunit alpha [Thermoanaerobaculia bacterium]